MELNTVEVLSKDNKIRIFIDGVEIKGITNFCIDRDASSSNTQITLLFDCCLNTKEQ